jgi:hypothetical protein
VSVPVGPAVTSGTLVASGVSAAGGVVQMGTHTWVADHLLGLCRLDPAPNGNGALALNAGTCNAAAVAPGQPAFDAASGFVYVPDNSRAMASIA